ncbi:MAG: RNA polymerase sigma-70 factor [Paludibacter sp.]|nr:RNA polymerase sigma-70 factor [Paludibacter sp.]
MEKNIDTTLLQAGDYSFFEDMFHEWYSPLCRYAYSILRDMDEAEDVVQQTFYKLWDQRKEIEIRTSINSYLYRMVHNACLNRVRQIKIHEGHIAEYATERDDSDHNGDLALVESELQKRIDLAIEKLPPRCREVFKLSRFEQRSYSEISDQLGVSVNTVETQIVKALKSLRLSLKDYLSFILLFSIFK